MSSITGRHGSGRSRRRRGATAFAMVLVAIVVVQQVIHSSCRECLESLTPT